MRRFTIETEATGHLRTVDVRIYPTARHMQRAVRRNSIATGRPQSYKGAEGVTSCFRREVFDGEKWTATPEAGAIYLVEGRLTPEVVAHEAAHMAVGIYERDDFEHGWHEDLFPSMKWEERFCYLVSDITREILRHA